MEDLSPQARHYLTTMYTWGGMFINEVMSLQPILELREYGLIELAKSLVPGIPAYWFITKKGKEYINGNNSQ